MSILTFFSLFACLGILVLSGLVLGKDPSRRLFQVVGLFGVASAVWSLGFAVLYSLKDAESALFWIRFYEMGLVFIPSIFYHFVITYVPPKQISWQRSVVRIGYVLSFVFLLLIWTPLFANGVSKYSWGFYPTVGIASRAFNVMFAVYIVLGFIELVRYLRKTSGRKRNQVKYLLAAMTIGFGLGLTNFFPLYGFKNVYPLGHFGAPITIVILAYAIIKHRLLDIDFVIRRSVIYSMLTAILATAYVSIVFSLGTVFQDLTGFKALLPTVVFSIVVALTFEPLHRSIKVGVDRLFFTRSYEYRAVISDVQDQLKLTSNPSVISSLILNRLSEALQISHGWLLIYNRRLEIFQIAASANPNDDIPFSLSLNRQSNLVEFINLQSNPVVLDGNEARLFRRDSDRKEREQLLKMGVNLIAPLKGRSTLVGILLIGKRRSGNYYKSEDVELISTLCNHAAISIENASLYDELQASYLNTVKSLVAALEAKDEYTKGHSERVADHARAIAAQMKLSESECQLLYEVSLLHDVGKIGVSEQILNKKSKLSQSELEHIQSHAVTGEKILSTIETLRGGLSTVRHHHERLNGDGYPDGLSEINIPLTARILAVADAYDAMTTMRPYRAAMTYLEAIDELKSNAGKQFDPRVVRALISVIVSSKHQGPRRKSTKTLSLTGKRGILRSA